MSQNLNALTKTFGSMVDFIGFRAKFNVMTWVFIGRVVPAECKIDGIAIATVQVMTISSVAVRHSDQIAVLLQAHHRVMCIRPHLLNSHSQLTTTMRKLQLLLIQNPT